MYYASGSVIRPGCVIVINTSTYREINLASFVVQVLVYLVLSSGYFVSFYA
jgi:hypothetical protein